MEKTWVWSLGQEDPLEEGMANHSSILAWESHGQRSWQVTVQRVTRSRTWLKWLSNSSMSTELLMPSSHIILCHLLLLLSSIFPSINVFSNELVLLVRWQSIGASASVSFLPMDIQGWFPLGLIGLIFLQSKGLFHDYTLPSFSNYFLMYWNNKFSLSKYFSKILY